MSACSLGFVYLPLAGKKLFEMRPADQNALQWMLLAIAFAALSFAIIYNIVHRKELLRKKDPWRILNRLLLEKGLIAFSLLGAYLVTPAPLTLICVPLPF